MFRPGGSSLALTGRNNDGNPGSSALQTPILHPDIQEPKNLDTSRFHSGGALIITVLIGNGANVPALCHSYRDGQR